MDRASLRPGRRLPLTQLTWGYNHDRAAVPEWTYRYVDGRRWRRGLLLGRFVVWVGAW